MDAKTTQWLPDRILFIFGVSRCGRSIVYRRSYSRCLRATWWCPPGRHRKQFCLSLLGAPHPRQNRPSCLEFRVAVARLPAVPAGGRATSVPLVAWPLLLQLRYPTVGPLDCFTVAAVGLVLGATVTLLRHSPLLLSSLHLPSLRRLPLAGGLFGGLRRSSPGSERRPRGKV